MTKGLAGGMHVGSQPGIPPAAGGIPTKRFAQSNRVISPKVALLGATADKTVMAVTIPTPENCMRYATCSDQGGRDA